MGLWGTIGRIGAGIATGGMSELAKAAYDKVTGAGGDGEHAANALEDNAGIQGLNKEAAGAQDPKLAAAIRSYSEGGNLQNALNMAGGDPRLAGRNIAMDPLTGSKMATEQVMNNPMLSGVYGKGGLQDRMLSDEKNLDSRGYSMQPQDNEAYGQASDNTARLYGQEEASLSRALASRGLASGGSGAAAVGFSGLQGNKTERLASAQRQIAQQRMDSNRQRLNDVRQQIATTSAQGEKNINDQFSRNAAGVDDYKQTLKDSAAAGQMLQGQQNAQFQQQQDTKPPGLGEILGGIAGTGLGALAGGAGAGVGGALGTKLGKMF